MAQKEYYLSEHVCPHWVPQDRSCQLTQNGLYLPITEHAEIYCEGGHYISCAQFMKLAACPVVSTEVDGIEDRRLHRRVPGRFVVSLAEFADDAGHHLIDEAAITLDLSCGGLCFESYRSLTKGSKVLFSLGADSSCDPLCGAGLVQWCRSVDDPHLYHAGISFADSAVSADISDRLGLPVA